MQDKESLTLSDQHLLIVTLYRQFLDPNSPTIIFPFIYCFSPARHLNYTLNYLILSIVHSFLTIIPNHTKVLQYINKKTQINHFQQWRVVFIIRIYLRSTANGVGLNVIYNDDINLLFYPCFHQTIYSQFRFNDIGKLIKLVLEKKMLLEFVIR